MNDFGSFSRAHSNNSRRIIVFFGVCLIFFIFYFTIDSLGTSPAYDYHPSRVSIPDVDYQAANGNQVQNGVDGSHIGQKKVDRPLTIQEAPKILIWTGLYQDPTWEHSVEKLLPCGCFVTRKRTYLNEAKIIIFHWRNLQVNDLPVKRSDQKWIWLHTESPHHTWRSNVMSSLQSKFDCWATYRQDSDFYIPYGVIEPRDSFNASMDSNLISTKLESKPKSIAWMVSNCKAPSGRDDYVKQLSNHIAVDIYGACGKLKCSFFSDFRSQGCWQKMANEYKFYLSFENSICTDYFTEKVVNIMSYNIIPIVFGGAQYSSVLPNHSFINALDYKSPKELASYLNYLSSNETAYNEYFDWKKSYHVKLMIPDRYDDIFCQIFTGLTGPEPKQCKGTNGENLVKWWFGGGHCKKWRPNIGLVKHEVY
ncbi:alpha-(1,3)-fucosyltransferase 6 [Tetranychus urticae]|uniref:Fucosyltransferase n=1 Tax=Tetranychus urticae TaxID=32264 RepID=T1K1L7_TETUR|nr:alpha-(1,3)-fucosyltransferase 6 [Tetranychus urticae]XP_015781804.1 alpha-(1,3)-fucosyltransferase 6 [Tetranychus urticae]XP_015781805.1 alpha-(1,3)-fucosyltransferase 6 [Tetranychus urticae]